MKFTSPVETPPGSREGAKNSCECQSREKRVQRKIEQPLHPIIAQAFQRVHIILREWRENSSRLRHFAHQAQLQSITLSYSQAELENRLWLPCSALDSWEVRQAGGSCPQWCWGSAAPPWVTSKRENNTVAKQRVVSTVLYVCYWSFLSVPDIVWYWWQWKQCQHTSAFGKRGRASLSRLERWEWMLESALWDWVSILCQFNKQNVCWFN